MEDNTNEVKETYTPEEVEQIKAQIKEENEKSFNDRFNKQWSKKMSKFEKEHQKDSELINLLKEQTGKNNIDDLLNFSYETYGVQKPDNSVDDKDSEVLGKHDAQEIISLDDLEEIESEVERLGSMKRTRREETTFNMLESYLNETKKKEKIKKEVQEAGIDESILQDTNFTEFAKDFKEDTPITRVYELYSKMNEKEKPFSAGSLKGTKQQDKNGVKDYYSYEESLQFTRADLDRNPELFKAIERSMPLWTKRK